MSEPRRGRRPGQSNYPPQKKEAALVLYREKGAAEAHRLTGIPMSTLTRWAGAEGVRAPLTPQSAHLPNVARVAVELEAAAATVVEVIEETDDYDPEEFSRRCVRIGRAAGEGLEVAVRFGSSMDAQRLNNVFGTMIDKLQLLNGRATSRREEMSSPEDATAQLAQMFAAIRAREGWQLLDAHSTERVPGDHVVLGVQRAAELVAGSQDATPPRVWPEAEVGGNGEGACQGTT